MTRAIGSITVTLVVVWVIAHLLSLGPVESAADATLTWFVGLVAASAVVAALAVLGAGLTLGRTRPAWLRFLQGARTVAVVVGCGLIVVGLLHYRDTQPHGELHWLLVGLGVLVGAGIVHGWVRRVEHRLS